MRALIAIVLTSAFVAGCATPTEQAAQAQREVERMIIVYGPACEKLGFKGNTDPWRNCIIGMSQKEDAYRNYYYYNNAYYRGYYY